MQEGQQLPAQNSSYVSMYLANKDDSDSDHFYLINYVWFMLRLFSLMSQDVVKKLHTDSSRTKI